MESQDIYELWQKQHSLARTDQIDWYTTLDDQRNCIFQNELYHPITQKIFLCHISAVLSHIVDKWFQPQVSIFFFSSVKLFLPDVTMCFS